MIQPAPFKKYLETKGKGTRDVGLWSRFVICRAQSQAGRRFVNEHGNTNACTHRDKFARRLTELLTRHTDLLTDRKRARRVIAFSPEARSYFIGIRNGIELEIGHGRYREAADHANKLGDNIARVAALLHVFEGHDGAISCDTLDCALHICLWYSHDFLQVFSEPPQAYRDAEVLYEWLKRQRTSDSQIVSIPRNHILQSGPRPLRNKHRRDEALKVLECQRRVHCYEQQGTAYVVPNPPAWFAGI